MCCFLMKNSLVRIDNWYWSDDDSPYGQRHRFRSITFNTDGTITIGKGYWGVESRISNTDNAIAIPMYVYGIK